MINRIKCLKIEPKMVIKDFKWIFYFFIFIYLSNHVTVSQMVFRDSDEADTRYECFSLLPFLSSLTLYIGFPSFLPLSVFPAFLFLFPRCLFSLKMNLINVREEERKNIQQVAVELSCAIKCF